MLASNSAMSDRLNNEHSKLLDTPFASWISKRKCFPSSFHIELDRIDKSVAFIRFKNPRPLYEAGGLSELGRGLKTAWKESCTYATQAEKAWFNINHGDNGFKDNTLDSEERAHILEEVGFPPAFCYSVYLVSILKNNKETIVYVGISGNDTHRWKKGHSCAVALHHPKYNGYVKQIYTGTIMLYTNDEKYAPLEWISCYEDARNTLESIESMLIYHFQPEINKQKKASYKVNVEFECLRLGSESIIFRSGYYLHPSPLEEKEKQLDLTKAFIKYHGANTEERSEDKKTELSNQLYSVDTESLALSTQALIAVKKRTANRRKQSKESNTFVCNK